jgi:hypothetical protein
MRINVCSPVEVVLLGMGHFLELVLSQLNIHLFSGRHYVCSVIPLGFGEGERDKEENPSGFWLR